MTIIVKNKHTLFFDEFEFKCCVGKKGFTKNKLEGDKKTPIGIFSLGNLYYRHDRVEKPETNLNIIMKGSDGNLYKNKRYKKTKRWVKVRARVRSKKK